MGRLGYLQRVHDHPFDMASYKGGDDHLVEKANAVGQVDVVPVLLGLARVQRQEA